MNHFRCLQKLLQLIPSKTVFCFQKSLWDTCNRTGFGKKGLDLPRKSVCFHGEAEQTSDLDPGIAQLIGTWPLPPGFTVFVLLKQHAKEKFNSSRPKVDVSTTRKRPKMGPPPHCWESKQSHDQLFWESLRQSGQLAMASSPCSSRTSSPRTPPSCGGGGGGGGPGEDEGEGEDEGDLSPRGSWGWWDWGAGKHTLAAGQLIVFGTTTTNAIGWVSGWVSVRDAENF